MSAIFGISIAIKSTKHHVCRGALPCQALISPQSWSSKRSPKQLSLFQRYPLASQMNGFAAASEAQRLAYNEQMEYAELPHRVDTYNGIIIDPAGLPESPEEFQSILETSIQQWKEDKRKGVWLKIPLVLSALVPVAAGLDFEYHHAEKNYVMMTKWLPENLPNTLPESATHQIGVGAFVMNDKDEILAVKEKSGPAAVFDIWKVPTGLIHRGEHLSEAAVREVLEETGVTAKFDSVLTFRHAHGFSFGVSDMFFVIKMTAETYELTAQQSEIADVKWIPISEFIAQERYQASPLHTMINNILVATMEGKYEGIQGSALESAVRPGDSKAPKVSLLYHCKM